MTIQSSITGVGYYLPPNILTNHDLEKLVDTSDEWILKRTGISKRHILDKDRAGSEMGILAAKAAIKDSGLTPLDIDLIIVSTESPDYFTPSMACIVQEGIGADNAAAFDLNAACSGFVYSLSVGNQFIKSGEYENILVIGCESLSKITDWTDRNTCVLFGDGAGAVVLSKSEEEGIINFELGAKGTSKDAIVIPGLHFSKEDILARDNKRDHSLRMEGREVYKFAIKAMTDSVNKVLERSKMTIKDVDIIVPHQANMRILQSAAKKLDFPLENMVQILENCGNMSSASIPIALAKAYEEKKLNVGDTMVFVGFGGGLTWASMALKWNKGA